MTVLGTIRMCPPYVRLIVQQGENPLPSQFPVAVWNGKETSNSPSPFPVAQVEC